MSGPLGSPFLLGAYWGSRAEPVDDLAIRLAECLRGLAMTSEDFSGWFRKGATKSAASREPVGVSPEEFQQVILAGQQQRDDGSDPMAELGYSVSLWNRRSRAVAWNLTCGAHPAAGVGVLNHFVIDWPERALGQSLPDELLAARQAMLSVIHAWDPDWASWTSYELRDEQQSVARQPVLGLITYLSGDRPTPSVQIAGCVSESVGTGRLLTLDPAVPDLSERVQWLRKELTLCGALAPTA